MSNSYSVQYVLIVSLCSDIEMINIVKAPCLYMESTDLITVNTYDPDL